MKKLKKFIAYSIILCLIISNMFSYTFADSDVNANECPACNSTPNEMQMYINFEVEMLGILGGVSAEKQVYGTNRNSRLFNGGGLTLPNAFYKSVISKIQTNFESEIKATRAASISAVLLEKMSETGIKDSLGSLEILLKEESFVRDYKILQEIDMSINDVMRDMGTLGIRSDQVSSSIQQDILNLQIKYSKVYGGNYPIFEKLVISQGVKNRELLSFLLRLNSTVKSMLLALGDNTPLLDSYVKSLEKRYSNGKSIVVEINDDYKKSIIDAYSCAKISTCNSDFMRAIRNMGKRGEYKLQLSKSRETIKTANDNLLQALGSWKSYSFGGWLIKKQKEDAIGLTDKQIELLHTVYGIDAYTLNESQIETRQKNLQQITKNPPAIAELVKQLWNNGVGAFNSTKDYFAKARDRGKKKAEKKALQLSMEEKKNISSSILVQKAITQSSQNLLWVETMQNSIDAILVDKGKDKETAIIGQNQDTHYFVEIGAYIHSIINDNIQNLVKDLGEVCTYQCSNKGTNNCYAK